VFLRGLAWAVEQGFDVINLSLGTTRKDWALPFYEICDEAYYRNCLIVTAANNLLRTSYPSLYASVTSVACNLSSDPMRFHYNPEPPTEFLARGIDVDVAWKDGQRMTGTGNSYAAPHIAGIAALVKSKHPELRPFQVKTVLWATAANVREAPRAAGRLSTVTRRSMLSTRASVAMRPVLAENAVDAEGSTRA
jgi:subtilisin family serine protease